MIEVREVTETEVALPATVVPLKATEEQKTLASMMLAVDDGLLTTGSVATCLGKFCSVGLIARYLS